MKVERFKSVWDAIEKTPGDAAVMKARSDLMIAIDKAVESWNLTQVQAAKRLKITQPRLNALLRGRINKFSLDELVNLATAAGLSVTVKVKKKAA